MSKSYFRPEIDRMTGYVPGEQPKIANLIKLNTNENAYPPTPEIAAQLRDFDFTRLRRYPNAAADDLRDAIAARWGVLRANVIIGNGSDDLLTMTFRSFLSPELGLATLAPTYSLYWELAAMQGAPVIKIELDKARGFALPDDVLARAKNANLLLITRPNAPTGNTFDRETIRAICRGFDGIVMIDEAYADFADDNCMEFATAFDNVIVMRTFSKSYSLAGIRLGYAVSTPHIIDGLMKLKDSYNADMVAQAVGLIAFKDEKYMLANRARILASRSELAAGLHRLGFRCIDSATNFIFAAPPDGDGKAAFDYLRANAIVVRYFPGAATGSFLRITVGTPEEMARLLAVLERRYPAVNS